MAIFLIVAWCSTSDDTTSGDTVGVKATDTRIALMLTGNDGL